MRETMATWPDPLRRCSRINERSSLSWLVNRTEGVVMYKVVWIARYAHGMTRQEASDYWAGHHGPLMKKVSPVAGYVQSHVQGPLPAVSGVAEEETLIDEYSCAWWNDRADFRQAM